MKRNGVLIVSLLLYTVASSIGQYWNTNGPSKSCEGIHPFAGGGCSYGPHCDRHCPHLPGRQVATTNTLLFTNAIRGNLLWIGPPTNQVPAK